MSAFSFLMSDIFKGEKPYKDQSVNFTLLCAAAVVYSKAFQQKKGRKAIKLGKGLLLFANYAFWQLMARAIKLLAPKIK